MRTLGSPVECSSKRSELVRSLMTLVHDLFGSPCSYLSGLHPELVGF